MSISWCLRTRTAKMTIVMGLFAAAWGIAPRHCSADWLQVFETAPGAVDEVEGRPVSARAIFDFDSNLNQLKITVENHQADPRSVAQNISDLLFTFTTGETSGSLVTSSGLLRTIGGGGAYTDGIIVEPNRWALRNDIAGGLKLDDLGMGQPKQTIIGPPDINNLYGNAAGSIAGNGPHNPFIALSAQFTISVPGLSNTSRVSNAVFSFGTTESNEVPGVLQTPEPSSIVMAMFAAAAAVWPLRRRWRSAAA